MMSVFHGHFRDAECSAFRHVPHGLSIIVGHHEIPDRRLAEVKESVMIYVKKTVQPFPCALAWRSIGGINKKCYGLVVYMIFKIGQCVPFDKCNTVTQGDKVTDTTCQCRRIPPGSNAFAILSRFQGALPGARIPPW